MGFPKTQVHYQGSGWVLALSNHHDSTSMAAVAHPTWSRQKLRQKTSCARALIQLSRHCGHRVIYSLRPVPTVFTGKGLPAHAALLGSGEEEVVPHEQGTPEGDQSQAVCQWRHAHVIGGHTVISGVTRMYATLGQQREAGTHITHHQPKGQHPPTMLCRSMCTSGTLGAQRLKQG